jgi:hypothetical protein
MKHKLFFAIAVVGALLLAGCVTIRAETRINPDLSGEKIMIAAMDDAFMEMAEEGEDPFADMKKDLPPNARVEDYHDEAKGQSGIKITVPFANLEELAALSESGGYFEDFDQIEVQRSGDTITMRVTVSTEDLSAEMGQASGETSGEEEVPPEMAEQLAEMFDFAYSVAPVGEIVGYSPQEGAKLDAETNTVTWQIDLTAEGDSVYEITWKPGEASAAPPPQPDAGAEETPPAPPGAPATEPPAAPTSPPAATPSLEELTKSLPCCAGCLPGMLLPLGGAGLAGLLGRKRLRF